MISFIDALRKQSKIIFEGIPKHFHDFPVSTIFLIFLILVLVLNIAKSILIWLEKKQGSPHKSCKYLVLVNKEQDCDHPDHRKQFKKKGNSCEGCWGKTFDMTDIEVEQRAMKGTIWKCMIILLANGGKSILPYISFFYTLIITILNNK